MWRRMRPAALASAGGVGGSSGCQLRNCGTGNPSSWRRHGATPIAKSAIALPCAGILAAATCAAMLRYALAWRRTTTHSGTTATARMARREYYSHFDEDIRKSRTCFGRATGQPLTEYASRRAAEEGMRHANARCGSAWLSPYQCGKCGQWHLAPDNGQAPTMHCACVAANGHPKTLFCTWSDAQRRADRLHSEAGIRTSVYKCELGLGYHLTRGSR